MADIDLESKLVQDVGDKASAGDGSVDPKTTDPKTTDPKATDPTDPKDPNAADAPASDPDAATAEATETGMTTQSIAFSTGGDYFAVVMKALGTKESIHIDVFKRCSQRVKEREVYKRGNYYYFYG